MQIHGLVLLCVVHNSTSNVLQVSVQYTSTAGCTDGKCCVKCTAGQTYRVVRRSFPRATLIGWVSGVDGRLHINSQDTRVVEPNSELIFVAGGLGDMLTCLDQPYEVCMVEGWHHFGRLS